MLIDSGEIIMARLVGKEKEEISGSSAHGLRVFGPPFASLSSLPPPPPPPAPSGTDSPSNQPTNKDKQYSTPTHPGLPNRNHLLPIHRHICRLKTIWSRPNITGTRSCIPFPHLLGFVQCSIYIPALPCSSSLSYRLPYHSEGRSARHAPLLHTIT